MLVGDEICAQITEISFQKVFMKFQFHETLYEKTWLAISRSGYGYEVLVHHFRIKASLGYFNFLVRTQEATLHLLMGPRYEVINLSPRFWLGILGKAKNAFDARFFLISLFAHICIRL